jgi:hypothetical protein
VWVLYLILGLLALFIGLLSVPFDIVFSFEKETGLRSKASVEWLFGLLGRDLRGGEKKPPDKKEKKKGPGIKPFMVMLRSRGFIGKLFSFIQHVISVTKIRRLRLDIQFGLDDPAQTGMLFAATGPVTALLRRLPSSEVNIRPSFTETGVSGHFEGDVRAFPIAYIVSSTFFILSPTTIRALVAFWRARKK